MRRNLEVAIGATMVPFVFCGLAGWCGIWFVSGCADLARNQIGKVLK